MYSSLRCSGTIYSRSFVFDVLSRYPKDITRSMHSLKTRLEEAASGDADGLEGNVMALPWYQICCIVCTIEFVPKIFCGECSESASVNCVKCGGVYCDACFAVVSFTVQVSQLLCKN